MNRNNYLINPSHVKCSVRPYNKRDSTFKAINLSAVNFFPRPCYKRYRQLILDLLSNPGNFVFELV